MQMIQHLNSEIKNYKNALNTYQRHPCLPALFALMQNALSAGVRFQTIENELDRLTGVEIDQFYGAYGSRYFRENEADLSSLSAYRPSAADSLKVLNLLWRFLGEIRSAELWAYKNNLVGVADWCYLYEKEHMDEVSPEKVSTDILNKNIKSASSKGADSGLTKMAYNFAAQTDQAGETARSLADKAVQLGFPMVPWASWVTDVLPNRPVLKEGLSDFSEYLNSYYVDREELDLSDFGFASSPKTLDNENAISVAKIAAFVIFAPLFKKNVYKGGKFEVESFWAERIEYLSSIEESFDDLDDKSEYLVAISNLLMVCAKLNVQSVTNGLASDDELERGYLSDVSADYRDVACLAPLPRAGFAQMLFAISHSLGGHGTFGDLHAIHDALRVTDYGVGGSPDPVYLDKMFSHAFQGMDSELAEAVRNRIEESVKRWVVPFQFTPHLARLYRDFWSDHVIVEKISQSLVEADTKNTSGCRLLREELFDLAEPGDYLSEDLHPAIFARTFSNTTATLYFDDRDWLEFSHSLYLAGQTKYASTVLALYLTICSIRKFYNAEPSIDIPAISKLLRQLSEHDSFSMVRQAIADLFGKYENVPAIYIGSLQEFLPSPKATLTLLNVEERSSFVRHEKSLLEMGLPLTRLSDKSKSVLEKAYALARDPTWKVFDLSEDAVRNYLSAIEVELQSRSPDIDSTLADELKYLGIRTDRRHEEGNRGLRGGFNGLGAICRMLDIFLKMSDGAQDKLSGFRSLATHSDINRFLSLMKGVTKIRNCVSHVGTEGTGAIELAHIESLLFRDGCIVRVLCETARKPA